MAITGVGRLLSQAGSGRAEQGHRLADRRVDAHDRGRDGDEQQATVRCTSTSNGRQADVQAPAVCPPAAAARLLGRGHDPVVAREAWTLRRWRRWSPTRSALAIAVNAGFTAPMLGKKLVSTT